VRIYLLLSILAVASLTSGCASVTGNTTQNVTVNTREFSGGEVRGAVCDLSNSKGRWQITTPGSTTINRSNDNMQVLCKKDGFEVGVSSVSSTVKAEMFGNIILGGGIGVIIDHSTGSGYEYPEFMQVFMRALSRPQLPAQSDLPPTASAVRLPSETAAASQVAAVQQPSRPGPVPTRQERRHEHDPNPQVGDSWTYRYSDGYGRTETYKVRLTINTATEIEDEIRIGQGRQEIQFIPGLELTSRSISGLTVREFSPYLQSFGPIESAGGSSVKLFDESKPFVARFMGTERVSVPAGTFEAQKLVVEGTQFVRSNFAPVLSRDYKITVWYAPAARRFVKMTISAPEKGLASSLLSAERDVIELVETSFPLTAEKSAAADSAERSARLLQ